MGIESREKLLQIIFSSIETRNMVFACGVITKGTIAVELSSLRHGLHNYNWAGTMLRTVLTDTSKKNSAYER
jgi:hypothetical protein